MNGILAQEATLGLTRPTGLAHYIFYEPAALMLWKTWEASRTLEDRNNFVEYCLPLIKSIVYANPHLYPGKRLTKDIFDTVYHELVITTILLMPKYDPARGKLHGFLSYKLWMDLWSKCKKLKQDEDISIDEEPTVSHFNEVDELTSVISDIVNKANLEFYELITFEHLLAMVTQDGSAIVDRKSRNSITMQKKVINMLHKSCGLQKELIRVSLSNLWVYYTRPELIRRSL